MISEQTTPSMPMATTPQARPLPLECPACAAAQEAASGLLARAGRADDDAAGLNWTAVCNTHAWQLSQQEDAAGRIAAARLRPAAQRLSADGPTASGSERVGRRKQAPAVAAREDCPFCTAMAAAARSLLERRAQGDGGEDAPLCIPHLCEALDLVRGRDRVRAAARAAASHFSALEGDLSELIRKSDYRFRGEPRGREATSWTRAATLMAGVPGVRWALRREPRLEG